MNTAGLNKDDRYEDRLEEDWAWFNASLIINWPASSPSQGKKDNF